MKEFLIRTAAPSDAQNSAPVIYMTMDQLADHLFGAGDPAQALKVIGRLFALLRNRFSHQFADIKVKSSDTFKTTWQLWQGEQDHNVSRAMFEHLARSIPTVQPRLIAGEGHISLIVNHAQNILRALNGRSWPSSS